MKKCLYFCTRFRENETPQMPHSSSGPGRRPLTAEIKGSTPLCGTKKDFG